MSVNDSSESNAVLSAHGINTDFESLTHGEVDKRIRNYLDPLNRQPEDLTRLIQGMSTFHRQYHSIRVGTCAISSATDPSLNKLTRGTGTSPGSEIKSANKLNKFELVHRIECLTHTFMFTR